MLTCNVMYKNAVLIRFDHWGCQQIRGIGLLATLLCAVHTLSSPTATKRNALTGRI